jgi:hypothetical protein
MVYSFLKTQYNMAINNVGDMANVVSYTLFTLLYLFLNLEAAQNIGRAEKAISQHTLSNKETRQLACLLFHA